MTQQAFGPGPGPGPDHANSGAQPIPAQGAPAWAPPPPQAPPLPPQPAYEQSVSDVPVSQQPIDDIDAIGDYVIDVDVQVQPEPHYGADEVVLPTASLIGPMLRLMVERGASDLHLAVGTPPRLRIDGQLRPLRQESCRVDEVERAIGELLDDDERDELANGRNYDFSFGWKRARFRGNAFFAKNHPALALRYLAEMIPTPESLGLPPSVIALAERPHGLVLVTGPTGSGKSTTIASLVERINQHRLCHIITLEDPIEYEFSHKQAVVNQREIGVDASSFKDALRSVLREDPDVVLIGEMRDPESIASALTIAETGHLVFATLHTNDAPQTIDRIIDMFPAEQQRQIRAQLSAALLSVVHQRLLPRRGSGRVAAFEVMIATEPVRNLIREGKTNQLKNVISQSAQDGMISLESYIAHLQNNGLI